MTCGIRHAVKHDADQAAYYGIHSLHVQTEVMCAYHHHGNVQRVPQNTQNCFVHKIHCEQLSHSVLSW